MTIINENGTRYDIALRYYRACPATLEPDCFHNLEQEFPTDHPERDEEGNIVAPESAIRELINWWEDECSMANSGFDGNVLNGLTPSAIEDNDCWQFIWNEYGGNYVPEEPGTETEEFVSVTMPIRHLKSLYIALRRVETELEELQQNQPDTDEGRANEIQITNIINAEAMEDIMRECAAYSAKGQYGLIQDIAPGAYNLAIEALATVPGMVPYQSDGAVRLLNVNNLIRLMARVILADDFNDAEMHAHEYFGYYDAEKANHVAYMAAHREEVE